MFYLKYEFAMTKNAFYKFLFKYNFLINHFQNINKEWYTPPYLLNNNNIYSYLVSYLPINIFFLNKR